MIVAGLLFVRFMISSATMTPEADAWISPRLTPAPSPIVNMFLIFVSSLLVNASLEE